MRKKGGEEGRVTKEIKRQGQSKRVASVSGQGECVSCGQLAVLPAGTQGNTRARAHTRTHTHAHTCTHTHTHTHAVWVGGVGFGVQCHRKENEGRTTPCQGCRQTYWQVNSGMRKGGGASPLWHCSDSAPSCPLEHTHPHDTHRHIHTNKRSTTHTHTHTPYIQQWERHMLYLTKHKSLLQRITTDCKYAQGTPHRQDMPLSVRGRGRGAGGEEKDYNSQRTFHLLLVIGCIALRGSLRE